MSKPLLKSILFVLGLVLQGTAFAAANEIAKADAARKKPLQRCDQMGDKAELDCLHKARERIVEARKKREGAAQKQEEKQEQKQSKTTAQR